MSIDDVLLPDGLSPDRPATFLELLSQTADTTYGMTTDDYVRVIARLGFEPLATDALGRETFHVYGREQGGLLLTFDTFHKQRNCASVQFRTSTCRSRKCVDTMAPDV